MTSVTDIAFNYLFYNDTYDEQIALNDYEFIRLTRSRCTSCGSERRYAHIGYNEICYECNEPQT